MIETTFANTPRIKGKPFKKRVGDDLLERDGDGHVCINFGYFSEFQTLFREKIYPQLLQKEFEKTMNEKPMFKKLGGFTMGKVVRETTLHERAANLRALMGDEEEKAGLDIIEKELRSLIDDNRKRLDTKLSSNVEYNMKLRFSTSEWLEFLYLCDDAEKA